LHASGPLAERAIAAYLNDNQLCRPSVCSHKNARGLNVGDYLRPIQCNDLFILHIHLYDPTDGELSVRMLADWHKMAMAAIKSSASHDLISFIASIVLIEE
jgi:hypothetical protein